MPDAPNTPETSPAVRLAAALDEGEQLEVVLARTYLADLSFRTTRSGNRKKTTTTRSFLRIPVAMTDRRMIQLGAAVPKGKVSDYYSMRHAVFALDPDPVTSTPWEKVRRVDVTRRRDTAVVSVRVFGAEDVALELDVSGDGGATRLEAILGIARRLEAGQIGGSPETRKRIEAAADHVGAGRRRKGFALAVAGATSLVTALSCAGAGVAGLGVISRLVEQVDNGMKRGLFSALLSVGIPSGLMVGMLAVAAVAGMVALNRWRAHTRAAQEVADRTAELDALVAELAGSA